MEEGMVRRYLCAWGNDAASEVKPRRVNCWLKTISNPPRWPGLRFGLREFLEGPPLARAPTNIKSKLQIIFSTGSPLDFKTTVGQLKPSRTRGLQNGEIKHNSLELLELSEFVKSLHLGAVCLLIPSILRTTAKSEQALALLTYIIRASTCSLTSIISVIGLSKIAVVTRKIFLQIQRSIANVQTFLNLPIDTLS
jgi:hypothetical protein